MSNTLKKISKRKIQILIILLVFMFLIVKIGIAKASTESFIITNAEVLTKSTTTDVNKFSFEKCKIITDVTFHQVGDSITYRIKVKNNEETTYTIKSVSDDNENKYIKYVYDNYEGTKLNSKGETTFEITEKYVQENDDIQKRNQSFSVNITFILEDENGNVIEKTVPVNESSKPQTGDNIMVYITIAVMSLIILIIVSNIDRLSRIHRDKDNGKHSGKGLKIFSLLIIGTLLLPTISRAATNSDLIITFEKNIALKDKLIVSYTIGNEKYEKIICYNEKITDLTEPEIPGYEFDGWKKEDGTDFDEDIPIIDDEKIIAKFTPIGYTISYHLEDGTLEEGKTNPTEYTVESDDIELNKPTKEGYIFEGWTGTDLAEKTENVTISNGSIGNREYTANWKKEEYSITFNYNGGIATENPTEYTIESDDIELNKPTKEGYIFEGWTGTDLAEKTENVTILNGSIGNREYIANWSPIDYTIIYEGLTDDEMLTLNNPTIYNAETESIILNNPENRTDADGDEVEKFIGWKENQTVSTNITIPAELGNKVYEAVWVAVDPNIYTVTYNLNDGIVSTENRTSFTKFDTFTLNNPTKRGYTFVGWTGSNGATPETTVTIPIGTRENLNYEANWTEDRYTIIYNLDGGNADNTREYTINSNNITLNIPTKTGYTFKGWTGTDLTQKTLNVTIPSNSVGNREYTANWQANTYTVIFNKNTGSGSMANQEITYDVKTNLKSNVFTKTGYTFAGWNTEADGNGKEYRDKAEVENLITDGEITLYAQWMVNNYEVTFTNDNATYEVQLVKYNEKASKPVDPSKDDATFVGWYLNNNLYDFESNVTENIELIARYYKEPSISLNLKSKYGKGSNVTISANYTVDEYVGLKKIEYYYYKNGTYTSISNINELNIGSYTIYAKVTDNKNNSATASASIQIISKLYDVANVGDYVQYSPTSTNYTSTTYDGITGSINPSATTSWRVLSKNSDGTVDIIPTNIAGKLNYGGNVRPTPGGGNDVDNIVYDEYENSLQLLANSFINSKFATSARAVTESDFATIKNKGLVISDNYAINKKDYTSQSWTGNGEGGANWNYYIYYANVREIKQFTIWYKYAGTGGQSSTAYKIELGVRPIVRLKAGVLENSGDGTSGNPWELTME